MFYPSIYSVTSGVKYASLILKVKIKAYYSTILMFYTKGI